MFAFDTQAMGATAEMIQRTRANGKQLQSYNALIAGHARALGATLVTANTRLAEALDGVDVVNWRG